MKQLILPTLIATLLLFSGCSKLPLPSQEPVVDPTLPKVSISHHVKSMTSIALEWKPLADTRVMGYYVYKNDPDTQEGKLSRVSTIDSRFVSHFTDSDLTPNTTYLYQLSSFNEKQQESEPSEAVQITTHPVLSSVSFFDSVGNLPRMAKVIWRPHDNVSVKAYILERQTIEKPEWKKIETIDGRLSAEYIDAKLDDNRVYKYRLRAVTYENIQSTPSDIAKVVTKPLPKPVDGLQVTTQEPRQISLSWKANTENDISFYNIYRSTSGNGSYKHHVKINETEFRDEINKDGENFYYKVTAVDKDNLESPKQINPVQGSTLAKPHAPSFIDAIVSNNTAVLKWKNNDVRTKTYTIIMTTKENWVQSTVQEVTGVTDTTYEAKDLLPDVQYKFQIMSVDVNNVASEPTKPADVLFSTPDR